MRGAVSFPFVCHSFRCCSCANTHISLNGRKENSNVMIIKTLSADSDVFFSVLSPCGGSDKMKSWLVATASSVNFLSSHLTCSETAFEMHSWPRVQKGWCFQQFEHRMGEAHISNLCLRGCFVSVSASYPVNSHQSRHLHP